MLHLSSLFGDYSCGDTKSAFYFLDFLKQSGFSYWQVLPFNMLNNSFSPYSSVSSFLCNPFFISLETLYNKELLTKNELLKAKQQTPFKCEYERLYTERTALLKKCAQRVSLSEKIKAEEFFADKPYILNSLKSFSKKENINYGSFKDFEENLFLNKFIQYEFFNQWQEVKNYAEKLNIKIIGDMPFYVDGKSTDIDILSNNFLLKKEIDTKTKKEKYVPLLFSAVPPDEFNKEGQLWGTPVYDFLYLKNTGFEYFLKKVEFLFLLFDVIRLDHFRGYSAFYAVKPNAKDAINGKYYNSFGDEIIKAFKEKAFKTNDIFKKTNGNCFLAENLGDIDKAAKELFKKSGFFNTCVLQFANYTDNRSEHLAHNFNNLTFAYTSTHDTHTLLSYLLNLNNSEEGKKQKELLYNYYGINLNEDINKVVYLIIKSVLRSDAAVAMFQLQDILKFGEDTRMNIPGIPLNQWRFRVTENQLNKIDRKLWYNLNKTYGRI